jgi:hypothetical protein
MDVGSLPAVIFSPAKMIYIAFIVLTGLKILPAPPFLLFFLVSVVFMIVEAAHNDYFRIRLNRAAEKHRG